MENKTETIKKIGYAIGQIGAASYVLDQALKEPLIGDDMELRMRVIKAQSLLAEVILMMTKGFYPKTEGND